jgi:hypothetical protein
MGQTATTSSRPRDRPVGCRRQHAERHWRVSFNEVSS